MKNSTRKKAAALGLLRSFFTRNLAVKIIALVFAMLLWGYVLTDQKPTRAKVVPNVTTSFDGEAELLATTDPARAEALYHDALTLARTVSNRFIQGVSLASLAALHCRTGAHTASLTTFRDAIEHWLDAADHTHQITTLRNLAVLFRALELPIETARLLGGLNARQVATYGSERADLENIDRWLAEHLSSDELAIARSDGSRLSMTDLARSALATIEQQVE